ncbi:hypothetical protein C6P45_000473 [Maudiozyma exigua]|uniref:DOD-type homing endonuclease domain-containing protein n=1 Tax=Maudiozyma exigua TaxID=34358 RepID=A0A9P6W5P6_MAUEX|nr:hypothetical protein C6P45_000473 [Kazachstania exigua]
MADGKSKYIHDLTANEYVMSCDGTPARVISIRRDMQKTYSLIQRTKHRNITTALIDNNRCFSSVHGRMELNCSLTHPVNLTLFTKPVIERSFKHNHVMVRWIEVNEIVTPDGRSIRIPKYHNKTFTLTEEGQNDALNFKTTALRNATFIVHYTLQVRDLCHLDAQTRSRSKLCVKPILTGNGTLSHFLTGQYHLNTTAVQTMAWLIGLWIGDGTTVRPEISVDSLDTHLMDDLIELCKVWNIYPSYNDGPIPLRAKHVKLYYGKKPSNRKYYHNCKTNNPFWKAILDLNFKNEEDGCKQIPDFLWNDDIIIREKFLAGLIDADGYVSKNISQSGNLQVNIQTIYHSVMKGIVDIARSLGISATVTTKPERMEIIKGKEVHCQLTYDCALIGKTPLQNILFYCHSGHKIRNRPQTVERDPVYFAFDDSIRGLNHVYFIEVENTKTILLGNKMSANTCTDNCNHEQRQANRENNQKQCLALNSAQDAMLGIKTAAIDVNHVTWFLIHERSNENSIFKTRTQTKITSL